MKSSAFRKYLNNYQTVLLFSLIGFTLLLSILWLLLKQSRNEDPTEIIIQYSMVAVISVAVFIAQTLFFEAIQDRPGLAEYLKTVRSELKVLGITLNDLHKDSDNIELIKKKILEKQRFLFLSSSQKNFQFLLLDPSSLPFRLRSIDEEKDEFELRLECARTISHLQYFSNF